MEVCDVVYALLIDRLERHVLSERVVAAIALTNGNSDWVMPSLYDTIERFDGLLAEDPVVHRENRDSEYMDMLVAVGLR